MDNCLVCCWETANAAASAAVGLLASLEPQQAMGTSSSSSSSSSGSSGTSQQDAVRAVLQAEHTTQWLCMTSVVAMLAYWQSLQGGGARSMPAAYSSMLEQLGCSREVGLWMAAAALLTNQPGSSLARVSGGRSPPDTSDMLEGYVASGLGAQARLTRNLAMSSTVHHPQLAALHLCMAAAILQWLSSMPNGKLLVFERCLGVCQAAARACRCGWDAQVHLPSC